MSGCWEERQSRRNGNLVEYNRQRIDACPGNFVPGVRDTKSNMDSKGGADVFGISASIESSDQSTGIHRDSKMCRLFGGTDQPGMPDHNK